MWNLRFISSVKLIQSQFRLIQTSTIRERKVFTRSPDKYSKNTTDETSETPDSRQITEETVVSDPHALQFIERSFRIPDMGHQVFVIQPYIKWGERKKRNTTPELQMEEAIALVKSLKRWQVVDSAKISLESFDKRTFFGKGNLQTLKQKISSTAKISAVFISVGTLRGSQQKTLENMFQVPVYDRYRLVIQIFREHAKSKEAQLQVQLAEISYLWSRLKQSSSVERSGAESMNTYNEQLLKDRESKIKSAITKLQSQREVMRKNRLKGKNPLIAVIGYTNAGKTSLIKVLTNEASLNPENVLFATLDVTVHSGYLPSQQKVLYYDTIGFISDIPTNLLESFVATLEDALLADVILHVRDLSHPDTVAQNENVIKTLKQFNLPQEMLDNIIVVGNKTDLLSDEMVSEFENQGMVLVSAAKLRGIELLEQRIEEVILKLSNNKIVTMRVLSGGEEYHWLLREATVSEAECDPSDNQYLLLKVIISEPMFEKFKHMFVKNKTQSRKKA